MAVVVGTYNRPEALEAVLRGLSEQSDGAFEVVIADDGSDEAVADVVGEFRQRFFGARLRHVWQPDEGYRLGRAFNLAALASRAEYLTFMPADAVPRRHFVRALRRARRPGWFMAGRRLLLSADLTERVLARRLPIHRWSLPHWLFVRRHVENVAALTPRDRRRVGAAGLPDFDPSGRAYVLTGVSRTDFERVNGYDNRFVGWGDEDVDLAVRLRHLGLRCGHAGSQTTLVHLWHESREVVRRENWWLLQETESSERWEAVRGLRELARETNHAQLSAKRVGASRASSEPENE